MLTPSAQDKQASRPSTILPTRVGWISSWNTKCGIAEYSKFILDRLDPQRFDWVVLAPRNDVLLTPDNPRVIRCWTDHNGEISPLLKVIQKENFDILVLQFSFAFQRLEHVAAIIALCRSLGTRVVIICHATRGAYFEGEIISITRISQSLQMADCILVHSPNDIEELRAADLIDNVEMFPHGYPDVLPPDRQVARSTHQLPQGATIIGSYGFLLPNKGIDKLVEAVALLRNNGITVKLLLINARYPNQASDEQLAIIEHRIEALGLRDDVVLKTEYLPNELSLSLLAACDVLVFPYQKSEESSSAAVRMGIASRRPVLCTPLPIFSDVASVVTMLPGCGAQDIYIGLQRFLSLAEDRGELADRQADWVDRHSWSHVAGLLQDKLDRLQRRKLESPIGAWFADYIGNLVDAKEHLQQHNEALVERNEALLRVNEALQETERNTRNQLQLVYQSTSWRLTRPLRQWRSIFNGRKGGALARLFRRRF